MLKELILSANMLLMPSRAWLESALTEINLCATRYTFSLAKAILALPSRQAACYWDKPNSSAVFLSRSKIRAVKL